MPAKKAEKFISRWFRVKGLPIVLVHSAEGWELQLNVQSWEKLRHTELSEDKVIVRYLIKHKSKFVRLPNSTTMAASLEEADAYTLIRSGEGEEMKA